MDRILILLQMHLRFSTQLNKKSLVLDYAEMLRRHIVFHLISDEAEGLTKCVHIMVSLNMNRDDLVQLIEVTLWPGVQGQDLLSALDRKKKTALTRIYKKGSQPNLSKI